MKDNNNIDTQLLALIDNISGQDIKLVESKFNADESSSGIMEGDEIISDLNINIKNIGTGSAIHSDNTQKNIIFANFNFILNYYRTKDDNFINLEVSYKLIIELKTKINELIDDEDINKILHIFFDNTGRIIIYPYFRQLSDFLIRESSFIIPPLPPLSLKNTD